MHRRRCYWLRMKRFAEDRREAGKSTKSEGKQSCTKEILGLGDIEEEVGVRTREEPGAGVGAHSITQPADKSTPKESQQRTERLLVGDTEAGVPGRFP